MADKEIAFVYCATCDEGIERSRIADHKKDGHKVEITYKNAAARFVRNAGENRDSFVTRFIADPYLTTLYPDDSERGIAADARWRELEGTATNVVMCPRCGEVCFNRQHCEEHMSADHAFSEEQIALAFKNGAEVRSVLENCIQKGLISNSTMQKLVTTDGFPKASPPIKFLMPGLVEYEYMNGGNGARVLVTKKAIDKMLNDPDKSIVGKPVINVAHRDVSPEDYKNGKADGVVTRAWFDAQEGWYCCEALIWDEDTRRNLLNESVSCEYTGTGWGPAGTLNQVDYDKEVTDGRFKHLAVVSGPRYEGAKLMNSTGGNKPMTKLFQWLKKGTEEVKNAVEVDARTAVEIDGKEVPLDNAIAAWKESEAAKAKAKADADAAALRNAAKVLSDDEIVTIDGKPVKVTDLKNALAEKARNASEEKMEKDHKDGEHKGKEMENCPMCNSEEKEKEEKEKKEKDAANAVLMNSQHKLGQHIQPNEKCAICDALTADRLVNAARMREGKLPTPVVPSVNDGLRRGKELMGKTRAQQEAAAAGK
jgi:hypothetical protein